MNDPRPEPVVRPDPDVPAPRPYVRVEGVTRKFGEVAAVDDVTLEISRGEVFCLLGGSGCGKTTLLRILAGLEPATTGRVLIDGVDVTGTPPYRRPVNMMFQSYALFPHMTVRGNVAFGLRQDGLRSPQIKRRVSSMLDLVKLGPFAQRKPHQLSGGQRQRVALARALIKQPKLLLLDEPLGALDRQLREEMQFELINIQQALGITFVVVTHDQEEAMKLSSRIGVMHAGRIVQTGTPTEIYEFPRSRFVARFIGSVNLFEGRVEKRAANHVLIASEEAGCTLAVEHAAQVAAGARVAVAVRPEKLTMAREPPAGDCNRVAAVIDEVAYRGGLSIYKLRTATGLTLRLTQPNRERAAAERPAPREPVFVSWHAASGVVLDS
ncbi:MAG: ABC transporter ATP-binding protein [Spirochaetaceae bacterium]|nr:ABC transporter ATP-binding protein [Spirochaetaceae bacterium]